MSELQAYVIDQVRKLIDGGQNPTVRRENLESDFVVYRAMLGSDNKRHEQAVSPVLVLSCIVMHGLCGGIR